MKNTLLLLLLFFIIVNAQEEVLRNGEFDDGRRYWTFRDEGDADQSVTYPADSLLSGPNYCQITINKPGSSLYDLSGSTSCSIEQGHFYTIQFTAVADTEITVQAMFKASSSDTASFWKTERLTLTTEPQTFGPYKFYSGHLESTNKIYFYYGGQFKTNLYLDAVSVMKEKDPNFLTIPEKFEYRSHTNLADSTKLMYRLCKPDFFDSTKTYPMVLCLHGAGERGTDNEIQIAVHRMATSWADSANQKNYPCFVVAPQCPTDNRWADNDWSLGYYRQSQMPESNESKCVIDMLDSLMTEFPQIDIDRLYITGLSMGGYGTFDMITRYPDKFAAAIPMSGGGDSTRVERIKHLPMWIWHGEVDTTVPVEGSRQMVEALQHQGVEAVITHCKYGDCTGMSMEDVGLAVEGGARLLYSEWENKNHVMWAESYDYPWLFEWVFAQNRQDNPEPSAVHSQVEIVKNFELMQNYPNPFNPTTRISYQMAQASRVTLTIYNSLGQSVAVLVDKKQQAGLHSFVFDASHLAAGTYVYELNSNGFIQHKRMTLVK